MHEGVGEPPALPFSISKFGLKETSIKPLALSPVVVSDPKFPLIWSDETRNGLSNRENAKSSNRFID